MRLSVIFRLKGNLVQPGFKPFIWKMVSEAGLGGWVTDGEDDESVLLQLEGEQQKIQDFIRPIPGRLAPDFMLKSISIVSKEELHFSESHPVFRVLGNNQTKSPYLQPDKQPSEAFLREIFDPAGRRFEYPFWAPANSGYVHSLLKHNPPTRRNTLLSSFPPCRKCREEAASSNPLFAKSPYLACPECGPRVYLLDSDGECAWDDTENCWECARGELHRGRILAMQLISGGFQLFVNATDRDAISKLRKRKKLPSRPLVVMARDLDAARKICNISTAEETLLTSPAAPVVILTLREDAADCLPVDLLNPDGPRLGLCLPPSALTHLLFGKKDAGNSGDMPDYLATISNNWDGKTVSQDADEALHALIGIADTFLCHDVRYNFASSSSIAVVRDGAPQIWRRSRGYVPNPIRLKRKMGRNVVAFGTDNNASVALAMQDKIVPSQHLGDIRSAEGAEKLSAVLEQLIMLFDTVPDVVACDMNPHLLSTAEAVRFSKKYSLPLVTTQSHHAQALAGMAENHLEHAIAIIFSNGAPGPDGLYWGAELFDADIHAFRRIGTFQPVAMPGKEHALKRPVRQLIGRFIQAGVPLTAPLLNHFHVQEEEALQWQKSCQQQDRIITTHAAARLFDAVSAGLGLAPDFISYHGQTAVRLEYAALRAAGGIQNIPLWMYDKFNYDTHFDDVPKILIGWDPLFRNLADTSWIKPEFIPQLALAFHVKIADAVSEMAHYGAARTGLNDVLLSGDMFMNGILLDLVIGKLRADGYNVHIHRTVPMDGSGICVGQAWNAGYVGGCKAPFLDRAAQLR